MQTSCLGVFSLVLLIGLWPPSVQPAPMPWSWDSTFLSSSNSNALIAKQNYPNEPIQRWVATSLGDEIPNMRDDLIRRKNEGQGVIRRHLKAWTTPSNWKIDPNYQRKQSSEPFQNSPSKPFGTAGSQIGNSVMTAISNTRNRVTEYLDLLAIIIIHFFGKLVYYLHG